MRRAIILAASLCVAASVAHAQEWRPIARQCSDEVNAHYPNCASCAGLWPWWSECTVKHVYGAQSSQAARIWECVDQVTRAYAGRSLAYGDRVGSVMACVNDGG
jgi:hypothetical protein